MDGTVRILGLGNAFRHDDATGLIVARRIKQLALPEIESTGHTGDGAALIGAWQGSARVILVDAIQSGRAAGTIQHFDALAAPLPSGHFCCSTHVFNVAEAIELARALGLLPARLELIGIEGRDFSPGDGPSPEVERSIVDAVARVLEIARKERA